MKSRTEPRFVGRVSPPGVFAETSAVKLGQTKIEGSTMLIADNATRHPLENWVTVITMLVFFPISPCLGPGFVLLPFRNQELTLSSL